VSAGGICGLKHSGSTLERSCNAALGDRDTLLLHGFQQRVMIEFNLVQFVDGAHAVVCQYQCSGFDGSIRSSATRISLNGYRQASRRSRRTTHKHSFWCNCTRSAKHLTLPSKITSRINKWRQQYIMIGRNTNLAKARISHEQYMDIVSYVDALAASGMLISLSATN
jgi:hypothetical protein